MPAARPPKKKDGKCVSAVNFRREIGYSKNTKYNPHGPPVYPGGGKKYREGSMGMNFKLLFLVICALVYFIALFRRKNSGYHSLDED